MMSQPTTCSRCGVEASPLYPIEHEYEDMNEHIVKEQWHICWDCSFEIMNGRGELDDEPGEIIMEREETEYAFDPTYYPKPNWLP